MSNAILSIINRVRARRAWETHAADTPEHDVEWNRVTGKTRWRNAAPSWDEPNPWRDGLPPTAAQQIESLVGEIIEDAKVRVIRGPVDSRLREAMRRASEEEEPVGREVGRFTGVSFYRLDRVHPEHAPRNRTRTVRRTADGRYTVSEDFLVGTMYRPGLTLSEVMEIIERMEPQP